MIKLYESTPNKSRHIHKISPKYHFVVLLYFMRHWLHILSFYESLEDWIELYTLHITYIMYYAVQRTIIDYDPIFDLHLHTLFI